MGLGLPLSTTAALFKCQFSDGLLDSAGDAYVTGGATSADFPITPGAFQTVCGQCNNSGGVSATGFVTELNPSGSALVYSTYLGGSEVGGGSDIAVDSAGNTYVTGWTYSTDFPVTTGAFQTTCGKHSGCSNAFVTKLNPTGSGLVYSTYLGGSGVDQGEGITVDNAGNAYVTGWTESSNFPTTPDAFQTTYGGDGDAFVTKFNPTGSALVYSTYLGGSGGDSGMSIAVDSSGNAYVTGITTSTNFPTVDPLQAKNHSTGHGNVFVTKLNPTGSALVYSTYLGGSGGSSYNYGYGIAVDSAGNAYVTGDTFSTNFPITSGAFQTVCNGGTGCAPNGDAFVAKLFIPAATTTALTSSVNVSDYGEAVTFTAKVTSSAGAPPNGESVTFMNGATVLGTGTLKRGSASITTSALKVGTRSVKAVYAGDANFSGSKSSALSQVVMQATTSTALQSSLNPSAVGQSVTFTATVTAVFGGAVNGNVKFYDGTTLLKSVAVSGGSAAFTTSKLKSGTHSITATYNGSASFIGSTSAVLTQTVN